MWWRGSGTRDKGEFGKKRVCIRGIVRWTRRVYAVTRLFPILSEIYTCILPGKRDTKIVNSFVPYGVLEMAEGFSFGELIRRVRAGDADATSELVKRYEPAIRLAVRARLTDPGLRRLLDSMDICQSVFASFCLRAAAGQYELDQPGQLLKLLETMARNKLIKQAEKQRADRRDIRRNQKGDAGELESPGPGPSTIVSHQELLQQFRLRLTDEERMLADQRALGRPWIEIATAIGARPDALRMQLTRALDRVTHELGLEE
jgi:RNA polymerase sigma factor (sigma-70 family)